MRSKAGDRLYTAVNQLQLDFDFLRAYTSRSVIMKVLMLGWEYPPHIAGGLGTACEGLTAALAANGVSIHFVVPEICGGEQVQHMRFSGATRGPSPLETSSERVSPMPSTTRDRATRDQAPLDQAPRDRPEQLVEAGFGASAPIERSSIPAFLTPYWNQSLFAQALSFSARERERFAIDETSTSDCATDLAPQQSKGPWSIFSEVERFTLDVLKRFSSCEFDIIHAHDWMTFPAGIALAQATKRPLIVHVHSLEHDRSGVFYDKSINDIERFGLQSADQIIAVSHYTKSAIERHHSISSKKIAVVHNGIYPKQVSTEYRQLKTWPTHVVLFLGRVTFQKGPEYFVEAARKVIPRVDDIVFVLAGDGDLLPTVKDKVASLKLEDYFIFPGFVQGEELEELFSVADLYVMPSVSEPFGIAALEAISFETPVLVSKRSGVSEVVASALTVDFWDTDSMANLIVKVLQQRDLRQELVVSAKQEIAKLHWGRAAEKTCEVYERLCSARYGASQN